MQACKGCPRECRVNREKGEIGFCGVGNEYRVSHTQLHFWEEPCISGERGSGAIFFSGCNLRCAFCQNREISRVAKGRIYGEDELVRLMLSLEAEGAENINLVTPTPYVHMLGRTLAKAKERLRIPVVYNCGGYESLEGLRSLRGLVDVYLPDFKYFSDELALRYSGAAGYCRYASEALEEMLSQTGEIEFDERGAVTKGVIIRHLVLPGERRDSVRVLEHIAELLPVKKIRISLMRQYTPDFCDEDAPKNLRRRLTDFEYSFGLERAQELGFVGYSQEKESASRAFTPDFKE